MDFLPPLKRHRPQPGEFGGMEALNCVYLIQKMQYHNFAKSLSILFIPFFTFQVLVCIGICALYALPLESNIF